MFDSREQAWSELRLYYNGQFIVGARGVRYKETSEDEHLYAAGSEPFSIQSGNKKYEGELTLLKSEVDKLNDAAVLAGYPSLVGVRGIDVVVTYAPAGVSVLRTAKLKFVKFSDYEMQWKQGDKFIEVTIPFLCLGIQNS